MSTVPPEFLVKVVCGVTPGHEMCTGVTHAYDTRSHEMACPECGRLRGALVVPLEYFEKLRDATDTFKDSWECPICRGLCGKGLISCEGFIDIHDPEEGEPTHWCLKCHSKYCVGAPGETTEPMVERLPAGTTVCPLDGEELFVFDVTDHTHRIVYRPEYVERLQYRNQRYRELAETQQQTIGLLVRVAKIRDALLERACNAAEESQRLLRALHCDGRSTAAPTAQEQLCEKHYRQAMGFRPLESLKQA
jgi:hypothetical protein